MARRRVHVNEAAQVLGISTDAVRKRARRGTLGSEKAADGHLYIWLDTSTPGLDGGTPNGTPDGSTPSAVDSDLVAELRDRIRHLEEANRENRRIIAGLIERIPELEPAPEPRESSVTSSEEGSKEEEDAGLESKQHSWLYRFFFGP